MNFTAKRPKYIYCILICTVLVLLELFYFRNIIGNHLMLGDNGDGLFCNLVVEHWYQFLTGHESAADLIIFYPVHNTSAYSDLLLGFAIPYSILRILGINMFLANKIVLIAVHAFGTFSIFYFFNKKLKVTPIICLIGTIVFAYSNMLVSTQHVQLLSVNYLPFFVICLYSFFMNVNDSNKKRIFYGLCSILSFEITIYTAFYVGYFFIIFMMAYAIIYCIFSGIKHINSLKIAYIYIIKHCVEFIVYIITGIVLLIPFFQLYLPVSKLFGTRDWLSDVSYRLPTAIDFINVAPSNLIFGKFFANMSALHNTGELETGFPVITLVVFFIATIYIICNCFSLQYKKKTKTYNICNNAQFETNTSRFLILAISTMAFAVISIFLLILKIGEHHSFWWYVYRYFPGASSLRAVARFNQFLTLPVSIVITVFLDLLYQNIKLKQMIKQLVLVLIFAFFLIENTWIGGVYAFWNYSDVQYFVNSVPTPPVGCNIMYVTKDLLDKNQQDYTCQLDAWLIASKYHLKTINGYSGQFPINWNIYPVSDPGYIENIQKWISLNSIQEILSYNLTTHQWDKLN